MDKDGTDDVMILMGGMFLRLLLLLCVLLMHLLLRQDDEVRMPLHDRLETLVAIHKSQFD